MYSESDEKKNKESLLSLDEIQYIDQTSLSPLDRHFIRLLAHSLACFKIMAKSAEIRSIPNDKRCLEWLKTESGYPIEETFLFDLQKQLSAAGKHLEAVADHYQIPPLDLTLEKLIEFMER